MYSKKSLGQNFLKNESIARALVDAANVRVDDTVVEVGPGRGMITKILLEHAKRVIAVEKDENLAAELAQKFANEVATKKLIIIPADILQFNPKPYTLVANGYKLVGSIPYYLTGQFLRRFLSIDPQPKTIALIIQKEVAERIIAKDGRESLLSTSVKIYGTPKYIKMVKSGSFIPSPKVDSAIITIDNISKRFFDDVSEESFFTVVRAGFAHPRKKLIGNLKVLEKNTSISTSINTSILTQSFIKAGIPLDARAENLSPTDWKNLALQIISDQSMSSQPHG